MRRGVKLYCIRHGETPWNAEKRYQGQADTPMNERGRAQAHRNGQTLKELLVRERIDPASIDFIASPLGRTRETMTIVRARLGIEPDTFPTDDRILEVHYGEWQGKLLSEIEARDPAAVAARLADPFNWRPDGGESYADLVSRVSAWAEEIERDTVVVTHGGVTRALRIMALPVDPATILTLPVPQDRIMILHNASMEWA